MVTHIVIPPAPAPEDEPPRPWPPADPRYNVLTDPRVSRPIKLWALLHVEPHSMRDICDFLDTQPHRAHVTIQRLRKHGQRVRFKGGLYSLEPSPILQVAHQPEQGVILRPGKGRCEHVWYEIVCRVVEGVPRIEVLEPPVPPHVEPEPDKARYPRWRPARGDYAAAAGLQPRSIPIWVWGLLKGGAWTRADLARELEVATCHIHHAITALKRHGHRVECDAWDRYYIREEGRPLRVLEYEGGLRLARRDGRSGAHSFNLW